MRFLVCANLGNTRKISSRVVLDFVTNEIENMFKYRFIERLWRKPSNNLGVLNS